MVSKSISLLFVALCFISQATPTTKIVEKFLAIQSSPEDFFIETSNKDNLNTFLNGIFNTLNLNQSQIIDCFTEDEATAYLELISTNYQTIFSDIVKSDKDINIDYLLSAENSLLVKNATNCSIFTQDYKALVQALGHDIFNDTEVLNYIWSNATLLQAAYTTVTSQMNLHSYYTAGVDLGVQLRIGSYLINNSNHDLALAQSAFRSLFVYLQVPYSQDLQACLNGDNSALIIQFFTELSNVAYQNFNNPQPVIDYLHGNGTQLYQQMSSFLQCIGGQQSFKQLEQKFSISLFNQEFIEEFYYYIGNSTTFEATQFFICMTAIKYDLESKQGIFFGQTLSTLLYDWSRWIPGVELYKNRTASNSIASAEFANFVKNLYSQLGIATDPTDLISCFATQTEIDSFMQTIEDFQYMIKFQTVQKLFSLYLFQTDMKNQINQYQKSIDCAFGTEALSQLFTFINVQNIAASSDLTQFLLNYTYTYGDQEFNDIQNFNKAVAASDVNQLANSAQQFLQNIKANFTNSDNDLINKIIQFNNGFFFSTLLPIPHGLNSCYQNNTSLINQQIDLFYGWSQAIVQSNDSQSFHNTTMEYFEGPGKQNLDNIKQLLQCTEASQDIQNLQESWKINFDDTRFQQVFEGLTINYNSLKSMLKNAYDAFKSEEYYGAGQNIGFVMNLI